MPRPTFRRVVTHVVFDHGRQAPAHSGTLDPVKGKNTPEFGKRLRGSVPKGWEGIHRAIHGPCPGADPPLLVGQTSCGKEQGGNDTADDAMSRQEDQPGVICDISTKEEGQNHVAVATGDRTETRTSLSNKCSHDQSSHESDEHVNEINHQQKFWTDSPSDHLFELSEGLWNEAYHSLKIDEPQLVSLYEEIMHQCWTPNSLKSSIASLPHSAEAVDNILEDNSKPLWAEQAKFLQVWMAEKDDPGRQCDKPFNAKQMIILFKNIVGPSALSMTGAAVPWVAACLAAKVIKTSTSLHLKTKHYS